MAINLDDYWKTWVRKIFACHSEKELQNLTPTSKLVEDGRSCCEIPQESSPRLPDNFEGTDMRALMQRPRALANQI